GALRVCPFEHHHFPLGISQRMILPVRAGKRESRSRFADFRRGVGSAGREREGGGEGEGGESRQKKRSDFQESNQVTGWQTGSELPPGKHLQWVRSEGLEPVWGQNVQIFPQKSSPARRGASTPTFR